MKSIAIIPVATEQGSYVARIKWRPTCKAGFEITSPNDLQSQTEPASRLYQTHVRLSIQERLTDKTPPPQRCVLPRSNDWRHIHVYLHTRVSANRGQYVLQHQPAISRARARFSGANGRRGMSVWGKEDVAPALAPRQMFSSFLADTVFR